MLYFIIVFLTATTNLAASPTAFGAEIEEKNGRVTGFGVVWALEVTSVISGSTAAEAGVQPGDIITNVTRYSLAGENRVESRSDQDAMREMLDAAQFGDSYRLETLRPSSTGVKQLTLESRVPYVVNGGNFQSDRQIFRMIYAGDWDNLMLTRRDPEARRGLQKSVSRMNYLYHNVFSAMCADKVPGDYVVIGEKLVKDVDDPILGDLYSYEGQTYTWKIRRQFHAGWLRSRAGFSSLGLVMNTSNLVKMGKDFQRLIETNGCKSADLRQFEVYLEQFSARANPT
ncbi:PDZ domain-containing protein [Roseovarius sp. ZX-A-9]|uniref:PDZ domain-containing protein n=1 Tax=Roseovarius sp. ZX-A-9 TaxID=3014783 RepID=UPI00232E35AC|nr:PDZ domain-containing protein [Roseovarius sp. ZX-A-9]